MLPLKFISLPSKFGFCVQIALYFLFEIPERVPLMPHISGGTPEGESSRQRNGLPGNPVLYNQAHRGVPGMQQPLRPHSTSARASGRYSRDTATRSSLLAADPGPNCPGILIPLLEPLRRVTPLYNLVVGGPVRGPHGGTHPKAVPRGQTHPASGPFLPRHAALKARPLEQSGPHTGTLTHRVNTTGYPW